MVLLLRHIGRGGGLAALCEEITDISHPFAAESLTMRFLLGYPFPGSLLSVRSSAVLRIVDRTVGIFAKLFGEFLVAHFTPAHRAGIGVLCPLMAGGRCIPGVKDLCIS